MFNPFISWSIFSVAQNSQSGIPWDFPWLQANPETMEEELQEAKFCSGLQHVFDGLCWGNHQKLLGGELPTNRKWVTTLVINGTIGFSPLITGVN